MKVLQVIPTLNEGGAERFVVDLSNDLASKAEVTLCTLFKPAAHTACRQDLSTNVRLVDCDKRLGFDVSMFPKLFRIINQVKPDLVHTHLGAINYVLPSALMKQAKFVHTVHNDAFREVGMSQVRNLRGWFFKRKLIQAVTISDASHQSFKDAYGDNSLISAVQINNGTRRPIATAQLEETRREVLGLFDPGTRVFVNVGRIAYQKNQLMLARVFKRLHQEGVKVGLMILGEPFAEGYDIEREILELGAPNVKLLGRRNNVADFLSVADYFCLSSHYEGLPISLLEALALGCIPVCTAVGGIVNVLTEGETGFLAKIVSDEAIYAAVQRSLKVADRENQKLRDSLRDRCVQLFDHCYHISRTANNYYSLYSQLLDTNRAHRVNAKGR